MAADPALVMLGPASTTMARVWVAVGLIPLVAVMVTSVVPAAVGVPSMRAVPLVAATKDKPAGSAPASVRVGVGPPVVATATSPA